MTAEPVHNAADLPPREFSVVVTSCGRFDLLRRTLQSLRDTLDMAPATWVVIEDSGDDSVRDIIKALGIDAQIIVNKPQIGQMRSIDKAYAEIKTPYAFHCEDDWEFYRSGFIAESFTLLEARPDYSVICLRPRAEENKLVREMPTKTVAGVQIYELDPRLHPEYFSYAFNPGLRRMSDYRRLGPFVPLGHEPDVSYAFKKAGFRIANIENAAVRHIGNERHVHDPTQPKRARSGWERLKRSVSKRLKRLRRALDA
ncbi:MAG: glycosyltransferase family A protein [Vitreimonas sp.]